MTVRTAIVIAGFVAAVLGLLAMATVDALGGAWLVAVGIALLIAGLLERRRYRSEEAELSSDPAGPGGGEPLHQSLDPRFRPTPEVFADPVTGHRMRVFVDPRTGERRYRADA